jgi:general secretion pathway protein J
MKQFKNTYGFTLMEVLIATAILAVVMAIVYGSFVQTRRVIGRTEVAVEGLRGIRASFNRITSDLSMAFLSKTNNNTFFVGTDDYEGGYPSDKIDFTSYSHRLRERSAKESDQMEVGYYLKKDFEGGSVLIKREKNRIDANAMYGGKTYELSEDIVGINLRYLEDGAWLESWDSRVSMSLPEAVEITVITKDTNGAERSYRTVTELPLGGRS